MIEAHRFDGMICIPNCDKIVPGMFMGAMRVNIPTVFVSGGPMEAGKTASGQTVDLIDAFVAGAARQSGQDHGRGARGDREGRLPDLRKLLGDVHRQQHELPGRGDRHGTAGQRHDPGHLGRPQGALRARGRSDRGHGAASSGGWVRGTACLPREIATAAAFDNAMILDMAMGGSTNTVLHILAIAHEAGVPFTMKRIDELSQRTPNICKVSPASAYHIEDVARAGGIHTILGEVERGRPGLLDLECPTVTGKTLGENIAEYDVRIATSTSEAAGPDPRPARRRADDPGLDRSQRVGRVGLIAGRGPGRARLRGRRTGRPRRDSRRGRCLGTIRSMASIRST